MEFSMDDNRDEPDFIDSDTSFFNILPDELVVQILSFLSPYTDVKNAKLVNKKWYTLLNENELHNKKVFLESLKTFNIIWKLRRHRSYEITETLIPTTHFIHSRSSFRSKIPRSNRNIPSSRYSHVSTVLGQYMYVFGGSCSLSRNASTYNDMFKLDLSTYTWHKVKTSGLLPAPRECCVAVGYKERPTKHLFKTIPYKGRIIMFGGWCQPPPERLSIGARFFDDTQLFTTNNSKWDRVEGSEYPSARAGHSGSIVGNKFVIFGGSQRNNRLNDVWSFDLRQLKWERAYVQGIKPTERFGQAQFTLNEESVMMIGGYSPSDELINDAWTLNTKQWRWSRIKVDNIPHCPSNVWLHTSIKVGDDVIVFSEEKKCKYCRCSIQHFNVPSHRPNVESQLCSCGRRNPEDLIQLTNPKIQMYRLDCSKVLTRTPTATWQDYKYLTPSPPSRRFFTAVTGINEIVIFGGIQNNSHGPDRSLDDAVITVSAKPP